MPNRLAQTWKTVVLTAMVSVLIAVPTAVWATHSFNDVPNSNTFHEDIEWLKQSGVTKGCNPPTNDEFCPEDNVTREQMSAFMRRLAQYMGAEDGTPALADAATTADEANHATTAGSASRVTAGQIGGTATIPQPQDSPTPVSFTTGIDSSLFVHAQAVLDLTCVSSSSRSVWIEIDGDAVASSLARFVPLGRDLISLSGLTVGSVPAGDHELSIRQACTTGNSGGAFTSSATGAFIYVSNLGQVLGEGGEIGEDE